MEALRTAPRRYLMPALPHSDKAAVESGATAALAFAIEAARLAKERHLRPSAQIQEMFTRALSQLILQALDPDGGDPAFQASVLQAQEPSVHEHVQLRKTRAADQRAVRMATDAVAHPGKLRRMPAGATREALAPLHGLAAAGSWAELARAIEQVLGQHMAEPHGRAPLQAILSGTALARLLRGDALLARDAVRRYQALCDRRGPLAGSHAAAAEGRTSAREGERAEQAGFEAFHHLAGLLNGRRPQGTAPYRLVRNLRTPRGFPGAANKAKEEWDAALLRSAPGVAAELVLLAEIKASPAAAASDLPRLLRGLRRLAQASAETAYDFASADGVASILGSSLRRLEPLGHSLPPHVIYCCPAAAEPPPQVLSAATKAVLLAEPASLAFAQQVARGEAAPPQAALAPVWHALCTAPRLRAALHQYETAAKARAAMLHPDDLLAAVDRSLRQS